MHIIYCFYTYVYGGNVGVCEGGGGWITEVE